VYRLGRCRSRRFLGVWAATVGRLYLASRDAGRAHYLLRRDRGRASVVVELAARLEGTGFGGRDRGVVGQETDREEKRER